MSKNGGWRALDAASHQSLTRFHNRTQWEPTSSDMPFERSLDEQFAVSLQEFIAQAGDVTLDDERQARIAGQWKTLQKEANRLFGKPGYEAAAKAADDFYNFTDAEKGIDHARDITAARERGDQPARVVDIKERMIGAVALFDFLQRKGSTPMDFFRQFTACGRALFREPWSLMTMHEVAMMEGQSPAAHSWRCQLMSGQLKLNGMKGTKLPGQKSEEARDSYRKCRKGNTNRKDGAAKKKAPVRQGSFLAKLNTKPKPAAQQKSFLRKLHVKPTPK